MPLEEAHLEGFFFAMPKIYNKKPTTYTEQISLLKSRGLIISNENRAIQYLTQVGYYRLSAYFLPYQSKKDTFNSGVDFDQILNTYSFDRELKLLVFDYIERIEISLRAHLIHKMSHKYNDAHWQDNPSLFKTPKLFKDFQNIIYKACHVTHKEVFIKHYVNEYDSPQNPPSWMCLHLLTIGELSRLYHALSSNADKQEIAKAFGLHRTVFSSWLHTLMYVRNICAHHSRLWNREFAIKPDIIKKPTFDWISIQKNNRTFYFLCILQFLLKSANPNNSFKTKLQSLLCKYPTVPIKYIGIPTNYKGDSIDWENENLWK